MVKIWIQELHHDRKWFCIFLTALAKSGSGNTLQPLTDKVWETMWVKDQSFNKDKNFQQGEGLCDCQITIQHLQVGQDVDGSHSTGHRSEDDSQLQ